MKLSNIKYINLGAKLALLLVPMCLSTSCDKDFLEAAPETSVSIENGFDTPARVLAQANGLYSTLKTSLASPDAQGNFLGGRYQIFNDIRSEEFINRTSNNVTGASAWSFSASFADDAYISNMWILGYLAINRSNVFLKGLEDNASKIDATQLAYYKGEAKFVRALAYFSLVQIFAKPYILNNGTSAGLPLRLQAETSSLNNDVPLSTVSQIYDQILKDLNEAESELPLNYSSAALNTTRAHKSTAIALKTRVYLTMGRFSDVITEGNKLVPAAAPFVAPSSAGVQHQLQASVAAIYTNYTTVESVFSLPMAATNAPGTQNQLGLYFNGGANGNREYYLNSASPGIYTNAQWGAADARKTALTATISGQQYVTKYSGVSPFIDWIPVVRYAEVLLNLAEAEAETGSQSRAADLLLAVHRRSDPTWSYTITSKENLINTILTERRIELLAEGFRYNDIARRGLSISSPGANAVIAPTDSRYTFPIPTVEIQNNAALR